MTVVADYYSPVGRLFLTEEEGAITRVSWSGQISGGSSELLAEAIRQLEAYFSRQAESFELPLRIVGSDFQRAVCAQMEAIPYGKTRTYGEIATTLRRPAQAVGSACGSNPIAIIVPCHRVVGATGLTGYSGGGGVETKAALLRHEGALLI